MTTPYPLGRIENHVPQNRLFRVSAPLTEHRPVRHRIGGKVLDQGRVGMCVGATGAAYKNWRGMRRLFTRYKKIDTALRWYTGATAIDPWPGQMPDQDTGTDMNSVAKIMRAEGALARWEWCFSWEDFLASLQDRPVAIGIDWDDSMFYPDASGRVHPDGNTAGGHETLVYGDDPDLEMLRVRNSWSELWGLRGDYFISYADMRAKLAANGDAVVLFR